MTFWFLFLSTPSARRATLEWHLAYYSSLISIHALREEGDSIRPHGQRVDAISIHALREEGDLEGVARDVRANISIHALREEGDVMLDKWHSVMLISIHALREEGDVPRTGLTGL